MTSAVDAVEMPSLLATLVVIATMTSHDTGVTGVALLKFRPGATLLHLAVDNSTGFIYVGAVNRVYQLTPDRLEPVSVAVTGYVLLCQYQISNYRRVLRFNGLTAYVFPCSLSTLFGSDLGVTKYL